MPPCGSHRDKLLPVGAWLSLVEHSVRDRGVGGSNPLAPTTIFERKGRIPSGVRPFVFVVMFPEVAPEGRLWVWMRSRRQKAAGSVSSRFWPPASPRVPTASPCVPCSESATTCARSSASASASCANHDSLALWWLPWILVSMLSVRSRTGKPQGRSLRLLRSGCEKGTLKSKSE